MFLFCQRLSLIMLLLFAVAIARAQTSPDEKTESVFTEEIKINIAATDIDGNFFQGLKKDDVVINEDGRLNQANSVMHIPAAVLIILDTGGESRIAKDFAKTQMTAQTLISQLKPDDRIALMQYSDKVELISDFSSDKSLLSETLRKKANFGRRSSFTDAIKQATAFLQNQKTENRHLVLISDGLDSNTIPEIRLAALRNITTTNINVHILSYTALEQDVVQQRERSITGGGVKSKELPAGAGPPYKIETFPIATINLDREMIRKNRERGVALKQSERDLIRLADDTNGTFLPMPDKKDDIAVVTAPLAKNIDSQYVVTYTPHRDLNQSPNGEVRNIEVTSKRNGVFIQAHRKLLVVNKNPAL